MTETRTPRNRAIALAGVFQSTVLVQQVARMGSADREDSAVLLASILRLDSSDVDDVYGGRVSGLVTGLQALSSRLDGRGGPRQLEVTRYVVTLLHLARKLSRNHAAMQQLQQGLDRVAEQAEHFDILHDNISAALAALYQETVSPIGPRILVNGEPEYLADSRRAERIRALLMGGIRSAVLWQQCGGSRWSLLFGRRAVALEARRILQKLKN